MASLAAAIVYHEGGHGILDDDHGHEHKHGPDADKGRGPKLFAMAVVVVAVVAFVVLASWIPIIRAMMRLTSAGV